MAHVLNVAIMVIDNVETSRSSSVGASSLFGLSGAEKLCGEKGEIFGSNSGCRANNNGNTSKEFGGAAVRKFGSFLKSGCDIMTMARILMVFDTS